MAGEIRARNAALLAKIETVEGTEEAPSAGDAIMVEEVVSGMGAGFIESTEITGSLDAGAPAVIGAETQWTMRARLRGLSSSPASSSDKVPLDALLRISGFEKVYTAQVTAAALSAGGASSATLGAGASSTAQAYRGMPLALTGSHAGKLPVIVDYSAAKVATLGDIISPVLSNSDSAGIPANLLYRPISDNIPAATLYHYRDGLLRKLVGARGTFTLSMDTAGIPILSFTLTGLFAGETDVPLPGGINPSGLAAPQFVQGVLPSPAFTVDGKAVGLGNYELNAGNSLVSPADPNTVNGFSNGILMARDTRLSMNPLMTLVATQNVFQQLRAGTTFPIVAKAGVSAGNRVAITIPAGQIVEAPDQDDQGVMRRQMTVKANGSNAGAFLCFY